MFKQKNPKKLEMRRFIDIKKPAIDIASTSLVTCGDLDKLRKVISLFLERYRKIPVVKKATGHFRGMITMTDILSLLGAGEKYDIFLRHRFDLNMRIDDIMTTAIHIFDRKNTIEKALEVFKHEERGTYPITYKKELIGIISDWDFAKQIGEETGIVVQEIMTRKPMAIKQNYTVFDVAKMMCRGGSRRLPVVEKNIVVGIVTPRDIVQHLDKNMKLAELRREKTRIGDIMNKNVLTTTPDVDIYEAVKIMKTNRVGGLPVVEDENLIGIITERDIVNSLIV